MTEEVQLTGSPESGPARRTAGRDQRGQPGAGQCPVADGGPDGVAPALAAELAGRLGVPLQLVPYPSPGVLGDRVGADEWDIALLAADPARATAMDFTSPYAELPVTYLAHAGSGITSLAEADQPGRTIVATRASAYTLWLEAHLVHATLVRPGRPAESRELFAAHEDYLLAGLVSSLAEAARQIPGTLVLPGHFMTAPAGHRLPAGPPGRPGFSPGLRGRGHNLRAGRRADRPVRRG